MLEAAERAESLSLLSCFRTAFYDCLTARADALSELTDALLCADRPVKTLIHLPLPRTAGGRIVLAVDASP